MTDESHDAEMEEQSAPTAGGDFSSGEGLVAFAGIVILGVWVIFDLIVDNYGMDNTIAVMALADEVVHSLNRTTVERVHSMPVIMKLLGWALVVFCVIEIILDLRFGVYDDVGVIVAALIAYAGYAMAFMGARSIEI